MGKRKDSSADFDSIAIPANHKAGRMVCDCDCFGTELPISLVLCFALAGILNRSRRGTCRYAYASYGAEQDHTCIGMLSVGMAYLGKPVKPVFEPVLAMSTRIKEDKRVRALPLAPAPAEKWSLNGKANAWHVRSTMAPVARHPSMCLDVDGNEIRYAELLIQGRGCRRCFGIDSRAQHTTSQGQEAWNG